MKTLKTLFALLLSAGMILTFTACGNSSDESSPEEQAPEEQSDTEASSDADSYDPYTFENVGFSYELPDDLHIESRVIGIVTDVFADNNKYLENAQTIVKETGVTYPNVRAWDGYDEILEHQGTPTTYFVDSQGKLIGAPILGAQITTYPKEMEELLSQVE